MARFGLSLHGVQRQNIQGDYTINSFMLQQQSKTQAKFVNQIPEAILSDKQLNQAISMLPKNYNFEMHKSIWRIISIQNQVGRKDILVSLQFPEGLMMFACLISDILTKFTSCQTIISGDVTYGACCIDDISSKLLDAHLIIHYGHSCLVPINETLVKTLYVFVEMSINLDHLVATIQLNFPNKHQPYYILGTIQFVTALHDLKKQLVALGYSQVLIPQERPRSMGETLGCTSPKFDESPQANIAIFICDGRFHMEAAMIQNPNFEFYQYNPYSQEFTIEKYDHGLMHQIRKEQIEKARKKMDLVCIIFGTLGRQGSPSILRSIEKHLKSRGVEYMVLLVSEINFEQLALIEEEVDWFVQIACPRLSIDWSGNFAKPILNSYECLVCLEAVEWRAVYPMDYYSGKGGEWSNYHEKQKVKLSYQD